MIHFLAFTQVSAKDAAANPVPCVLGMDGAFPPPSGNRKHPGWPGSHQGLRLRIWQDLFLTATPTSWPLSWQVTEARAPQSSHLYDEGTMRSVWLGACNRVSPQDVVTSPYLYHVRVPGTGSGGASDPNCHGSHTAGRGENSPWGRMRRGWDARQTRCRLCNLPGPFTSLRCTWLAGQVGIQRLSPGALSAAMSVGNTARSASPPGEQDFPGSGHSRPPDRRPGAQARGGGLPPRRRAGSRHLERPAGRAAPERPAGGRLSPRAGRVLASPRRLQPPRLLKGPRGRLCAEGERPFPGEPSPSARAQ